MPLSLLDAIASRQDSLPAPKETPLFSRAQAISVKLDTIDHELRTHLASEVRQALAAEVCEEPEPAGGAGTLRHGPSQRQSCHVHMVPGFADGDGNEPASLLLSLSHVGVG